MKLNSKVVLIISLVAVVIICYYSTKKSNSSWNGTTDIHGIYNDSEPYEPQKQYELLDVPPEQPAHDLQFGMGPGVYGSGRHTSEMVGN